MNSLIEFLMNFSILQVRLCCIGNSYSKERLSDMKLLKSIFVVIGWGLILFEVLPMCLFAILMLYVAFNMM